MTDKRQKAAKVKCKHNESLTKQSIYVEYSILGSCLLWIMSTEISVDIAVDIAVDTRSIVGRHSVDSRPTLDRQSVDTRSTLGR